MIRAVCDHGKCGLQNRQITLAEVFLKSAKAIIFLSAAQGLPNYIW